uniref:Putative DNA binding protein isoform 1 n=1 Tax=Davidia involucrata TaxID=16924 RepID=A0A5B7BSE2_DAVIN
MEEVIEVDVGTTIAEVSGRKRGKKKVKGAAKKKTRQGRTNEKGQGVAADGESLPGSVEDSSDCPPGISVSLFDYSVENHFRAVDTICKLCGEAECDDFDKNEIERLSSSIIFLREWRHFNYQSRIVKFACQSEGPQGKDVIGAINLPQFSAATVPKKDRQNESMISPESSKDFVMYVGGPVWALDWCPRVNQRSDCHIKCEFLAVAAHPPDSSYHKIGAPLTGRGVVQVWCLLNVIVKEEEVPQVGKKPKGNPKNSKTIKVKSTQPKRPRGRPKKKAINESVDNLDCNNHYMQPLAVQFPEDSSKLLPIEGIPMDTHEYVAKKKSGRKRKASSQGVSTDKPVLTASTQKRRLKDKASEGSHIHGNGLPSLTQNENKEFSLANPQTCSSWGQDPVGSSENASKNDSLETSPGSYPIPKDVALPRVVLCLAHNGKVAWDVKWRPSNVYDAESKHRMGYLAVLLGNGALEVWEVPFPRAIKAIYSAYQKEGTDPRFVKLEPVFRCSKLKCGDRQSIPLTVEWSASSPYDFILAGCHDGMVALWKFTANGSSKDTRPLLCFSADTVPIRALAWAPNGSDPESANVIVTAGHRGLKFWDLRDPFRPLWDLNPVQRVIYSLDWLPDPRCVIVSFDDGTLRILSLVKAAYDVPVTGKPFVGTQQQGFHSYYCSSFTIWSVQVSRLTGMVAYCSADGTVLRFQLTTRAVEKDPLRNRAPHFLCGSLTEEESALTLITPLPDIPFPMKKSLNEWCNAPRTIRGFLSESNQAKRAKDQMAKGQTSDDQTLALCYGDDPGIEFGSEDTSVSQKSKHTPKLSTSSKKKVKADQALVCNDEPENVQREDSEKGEVGNEVEVFPPKIVAMHRVRWNMNKGSERWLCYGGAAGIIRCQEIDVSDA